MDRKRFLSLVRALRLLALVQAQMLLAWALQALAQALDLKSHLSLILSLIGQ